MFKELRYQQIDKYAWENSKDRKWVKIDFLSGFEGVGKLDKANIQCDFEDQSVDLKVQGLNGKNLRFIAGELQCPINVGESKIKVGSNGITVYLKKVDPLKEWTSLKPGKKTYK